MPSCLWGLRDAEQGWAWGGGLGFGVSSRRCKPSPGNSSGQPLKPLFVLLGFLTFPAAADPVPGAGWGARFQMGCPASPRLCWDGRDGIWGGFRGCGCPFPPIPSEPRLCRSPGCHGDPVPPPGDPQRPLPVRMKDWGCRSLLGVGPCCAEQQDPSLPATSSSPNATGRALPGHSAGLAAKASLISCLAPAPGNDLGCLSCASGCWDPLGPGEEAASLAGQEEAAVAVAGDTLQGPASPPRKESAADFGDPQGAAATGRPSLGGLWVGGGGSTLPRPGIADISLLARPEPPLPCR